MARVRQYADRVDVIKMVKVNGRWPFARVVERNRSDLPRFSQPFIAGVSRFRFVSEYISPS